MQIAEKALKGMELCCGVFPKFWKKWVAIMYRNLRFEKKFLFIYLKGYNSIPWPDSISWPIKCRRYH
jgi:hypothetical protein